MPRDLFRYGGIGVLRHEAAHKLKGKESISFSGKAMLHLLRARLAPARTPVLAAGAVENRDSRVREDGDVEGAKFGALSKVFKLWNKDAGEGQSRAKKKLATVR